MTKKPGRAPVFLFWVLAVLPVAAATVAQERDEPLVLHAVTLTHQSASEALPLVQPLLSIRGSVELQPENNTLVIRDVASAVARVEQLLTEFDHPARGVRLQIRLVEADASEAQSPSDAGLPEELVKRLRDLLRFQSFRLLARAALDVHEGEEVTYQLGQDYQVGFRLGALLPDRRVRLQGFRVARRVANPGAEDLIHTNLNLWLDQPMVLGLARAESSDRALMVVLTSSVERGR